jgi:hypothetical protein
MLLKTEEDARVNQCRPYRERAKHNAGRLVHISDNDSDGLTYGSLPSDRRGR